MKAMVHFGMRRALLEHDKFEKYAQGALQTEDKASTNAFRKKESAVQGALERVDERRESCRATSFQTYSSLNKEIEGSNGGR